MERKRIQEEIDRLADKMSELEVGSEEYNKLLQAMQKLHEMLYKDIEAENTRIAKTMDQDLKERELDQRDRETEVRAKASKWDAVWNFLGKLASGVVAIGGVLLLGEIKEDQGVVDKDKFSLVRGMFPKG